MQGEYSNEFAKQYNVTDSSGYPLTKRIINKAFNSNNIQSYHYRPFDNRFIYFDDTIISRPAKEVTKHIIEQQNLILIVPRQVNEDFHHAFISKIVCDSNITSSARLFGAGRLFPLYLYPVASSQQSIEEKRSRIPNFRLNIVQQIAEKLSLIFTSEKEATEGTFAPVDLLDYIYAKLHSSIYCQTYKEFLKIDFPRVPYPTDQNEFWRLVNIGSELRKVHLLEAAGSEKYITQYPVDGDNVVVRTHFELSQDSLTGKVWINESQYFDRVPFAAWDFYIGGYQPAQKWLKDRKGRELGFEDILHYQKIIVALKETGKLMEEVDNTVVA